MFFLRSSEEIINIQIIHVERKKYVVSKNPSMSLSTGKQQNKQKQQQQRQQQHERDNVVEDLPWIQLKQNNWRIYKSKRRKKWKIINLNFKSIIEQKFVFYLVEYE